MSVMKIRLICVEDGMENIGFRKISAFIKSIHSDTVAAYVPTGNMRGVIRTLIGKGAGELSSGRDSEIPLNLPFIFSEIQRPEMLSMEISRWLQSFNEVCM